MNATGTGCWHTLIPPSGGDMEGRDSLTDKVGVFGGEF